MRRLGARVQLPKMVCPSESTIQATVSCNYQALVHWMAPSHALRGCIRNAAPRERHVTAYDKHCLTRRAYDAYEQHRFSMIRLAAEGPEHVNVVELVPQPTTHRSKCHDIRRGDAAASIIPSNVRSRPAPVQSAY
jgi:hypothetical protein